MTTLLNMASDFDEFRWPHDEVNGQWQVLYAEGELAQQRITCQDYESARALSDTPVLLRLLAQTDGHIPKGVEYKELQDRFMKTAGVLSHCPSTQESRSLIRAVKDFQG